MTSRTATKLVCGCTGLLGTLFAISVVRVRQLRLASRVRRTDARVAPDPGVEVVRRADYQETLDCLATLKDGDQEVLRLAAWEELKPAEIGQVIGVAPHAASARLSRARDRLAKAMHMERAGVAGWLAPRPDLEGGEW